MLHASQRRVVIPNLFDKGNIKTEGDDSDSVLTRRSRSAASQAHSDPVENKIFSQNVMRLDLMKAPFKDIAESGHFVRVIDCNLQIMVHKDSYRDWT